jgi:hypothetical protein
MITCYRAVKPHPVLHLLRLGVRFSWGTLGQSATLVLRLFRPRSQACSDPKSLVYESTVSMIFFSFPIHTTTRKRNTNSIAQHSLPYHSYPLHFTQREPKASPNEEQETPRLTILPAEVRAVRRRPVLVVRTSGPDAGASLPPLQEVEE